MTLSGSKSRVTFRHTFVFVALEFEIRLFMPYFSDYAFNAFYAEQVSVKVLVFA